MKEGLPLAGADASGSLGSGAMFDRIADRYDLLNRILSLGIDERWRAHTVEALDLRPGMRVLDLATGTGDLAIQLARHPARPEVVGADASARMLRKAGEKVIRAGLFERVTLSVTDAQAMSFADGSFDAACMAFGIRNVSDRPAALRELARVLRPKGRVAILELMEPQGGWLSPLSRFYVHTLVPRIGAFLSGAREYRYLQESIAAFPSPGEFRALMEGSGFSAVESRLLTFGACCLFIGTAVERS
jgi:demethylmenaquinone methyltransferase / 2-methoxy-6-polyprenyl-1,4-benzoquinol methylase